MLDASFPPTLWPSHCATAYFGSACLTRPRGQISPSRARILLQPPRANPCDGYSHLPVAQSKKPPLLLSLVCLVLKRAVENTTDLLHNPLSFCEKDSKTGGALATSFNYETHSPPVEMRGSCIVGRNKITDKPRARAQFVDPIVPKKKGTIVGYSKQYLPV